MTRLATIAVLFSALSIFATAQVTYTAGPASPGTAEAAYSPSAAYPAGQQAPFANVFTPNATLLAPIAGALAGGLASDDRNGILYTSNGFQMAMDQNLTYQGFGPLALVPGGVNPILLPGGAGPLTGLCFDDGANALWGTDGAVFWQMQPLPPFNPITLPLPIPGLLSPASGLGWDPASNSLYACAFGGGIYHFTPGGAPIGLQPVNIIPSVGLLQGAGVNTSNGPGAFGPPFCSTQIPGYHVTVSDGLFVYDALLPNPPIPLTGLTAANQVYGHTYSSDFQVKRCDAVTTPPVCIPSRAGTLRVNYVGPGSFQALRCISAPPTTPGFLVADLCPLPSCFFGSWLNPFTWGTLPITTDAAGEHTLPLNMTTFPPGLQLSFQYAIFDVLAPLSYCFSNLCTFTCGLP